MYMYMHMFACIWTIIWQKRRISMDEESAIVLASSLVKRELEYRIPRLHYPVNFRRFPKRFEDLCRYSWKTVFSQFAPTDFRRKPEPVPRTRLCSYWKILLTIIIKLLLLLLLLILIVIRIVILLLLLVIIITTNHHSNANLGKLSRLSRAPPATTTSYSDNGNNYYSNTMTIMT